MTSQIKFLLSDISGHGNRHLLEIEADLAQVNLLLDEAISKLARSFEGICQTVGAHQEMMQILVSKGELDQALLRKESLSKLNAINEDLNAHVRTAVTGLQFEDMTCQLINRIIRRVEGLREMLDSLNEVVLESLDEESENHKKAALLEKVDQALRAKSQELDILLRKAVGQRHMESGEIELF